MTGVANNYKEVEKCIRLAKDVLVLGGGISGIVLSDALALAGIYVTIVEKADNISNGKRSCHVSAQHNLWDELIKEKIPRLMASKNATVITGAELARLDGHFGAFKAIIKKNDGQTLQLMPSVVVAATGYETERYSGLPEGENVCDLSDLASLISSSRDKKIYWKSRPVSSVAFLLDLANDDIKIDSIAVLNQALTLRTMFDCEVSVICRDLKVSFTGGERLYLKAREEGVLFFKYDKPPVYLLSDNIVSSIEVPDNTTLSDETRERIAPDLIVLPETCLPGQDTEKICRLLGINVEEGGYMMDDNPQFSRIRSNRRGIYVAGACRFPQDLWETLYEAKAAAQEITSLLTSGVYELGKVIAEVDANKCALCYTCPRLCPHGAIRIVKYAKQNVYRSFNNDGNGGDVLFNAARVEPAACYGCGICVAECPARAITLCGETPTNRLLARI